MDFIRQMYVKSPYSTSIKVVLTLRNQVDFLGSLSAQLGYPRSDLFHPNVLEADAALRFYEIVDGLQKVIGKDNLMLLFHEDGLEANTQKMLRFMDCDLKHTEGIFDATNVRGTTTGVWVSDYLPSPWVSKIHRKLNANQESARLINFARRILPGLERLVPKKPRQVVVTTAQRERVRDVFKENNEKLSSLVGRDLEQIGY